MSEGQSKAGRGTSAIDAGCTGTVAFPREDDAGEDGAEADAGAEGDDVARTAHILETFPGDDEVGADVVDDTAGDAQGGEVCAASA